MDRASDSMIPPAGGRVLLIGDIRKAVLDAVHVDRYPCDVRPSLLEGIDAAVRGRFAAVGVVMDGTTHELAPALKALRAGTQAKIFLLAQMHEEPIARRLVEPGSDERSADAYLVCPTCLASLCAHAGLGPSPEDAGARPENDTAAHPLSAGPLSSSGVPAGFRTARPGESEFPREGAAPLNRPPGSEVSFAELEQKIRYLERLATTDDLTGLKNRRYIWEFARQILDHARETNGRVTLLVFDIDDFKHYNDVYGHLTGDEILRQAGLLMRRCCRSHDVVGRIGGDEFAVVFWDDPNQVTTDVQRERRSATAEHPRQMILVAQRFQKAFGNADLQLLGPDGRGVLTISGGLASFPRDGTTVQQLFERADLALREAKGSGKNRIYLVGEPEDPLPDIH